MVAAQPQQPQQQLADKASASAAGPTPGPVVTQQQQQDEGEEPAKPQHAGSAASAPLCPQQQQGVLHFNWEQRSQARACMQTLVLALADDPVNAYFSGSRRRRFVKDEVKGYLKALRCATNFIATPDSCAVALWQLLPQETPRNELWAGWTRILRVPPRLWRQLLRLELHYEAAHTALAAAVGSYYYLSFIGTRPEARGRGLGGALLAHITTRADAEGRWCLLEATSQASQALYARHGFETYEAFRVSPGAPPVFLMKRPPAPVTTAVTTAVATPAPAPAVVVDEPAAAGSAVSLADALAAKVAAAGAAGQAAGPGSECGSDHSALIGTLAAAEEATGHDEQQQQQQVLLRLDEEAVGAGSSSSSSASSSEDEQESDSEGEEEAQGAARAVAAAATVVAVGAAAVMGGDAGVLVRSNSSVARGLKELGEAAAGAAAAAVAATTTTSSSSSSSNLSSSRAGAGGPNTDGCC